MKIALFGPPGAGKGTQSKLMTEKYDIVQISMGDLLRNEVREGTSLGKMASEYMDKGQLVPDEVVISMLKERLDEPGLKKGFILDGFPRSLSQAEELDRIVDLDMVINMRVDDQFLVTRITGRRMCPCGAAYHIVFNPPMKEGFCDECNQRLYQRDDDTEETVKRRLDVYHKETEPVLDFYRKKGILKEVNGNKSIAEIRHDMVELLDPLEEG